MMGRKLLAVFLTSALASPGWAAGKIIRPPSVGQGTSYGVDPYVAEFEQKMRANNEALQAMQKAIEAVKIPEHSQKGALAAKLAIVAEFAGMAALKADSAAAVKKFTDHIKGLDERGLQLGSAPRTVEFGDKKDDSSLRPKDDRTFRGAAHNSATMPEQARDSVAAHATGQSAAVSRPTLHPMNAPVGYGGQVGAGFGAQPLAVKAAYSAPPAGPAQTDNMTINIAPGAGAASAGGGGAGMNSANVSAPGASVGKTESDSKPGTNPANESLSKNSSDVAAKAQAAKEKAAADAKAARDKAAEDEKQRQQQQQQMAMQAAQQAAQAASKAAEGANKQQQKGQGGGGGGQSLNQAALDAAQEQARQNGALQERVAAAEKKQKEQAEQIEQLNQRLNDQAVAANQPPPAL